MEFCSECGLVLADDGVCCGCGRWERLEVLPEEVPSWLWRLAAWLDGLVARFAK